MSTGSRTRRLPSKPPGCPSRDSCFGREAAVPYESLEAAVLASRHADHPRLVSSVSRRGQTRDWACSSCDRTQLVGEENPLVGGLLAVRVQQNHLHITLKD